MAPIERIARFMETLDYQFLDDAFAGGDVVLIENFPPYVFKGGDAVARWAKGFAEHAKNISGPPTFFRRPARFSLGRRARVPFPAYDLARHNRRKLIHRNRWLGLCAREACRRLARSELRVGGDGHRLKDPRQLIHAGPAPSRAPTR